MSSASQVQQVVLEDIYEVEKQLGTGRWGNIHLATHKVSRARIALKVFSKSTVRQSDFVREYNTSLFLNNHPNIIDTYEGLYATADIFFFVQELSPCGSLRDIVERSVSGLPEESVKKILREIIGGLEFIHKKDLVHRNVQAKNVMVFDPNFSRIKVADFGLTRKEGTMVKHFDSPNEYHAHELCEVLQKEMYAVEMSVDIWAVGICIFFCLTGGYPWELAKVDTPNYDAWRDHLKGKAPKVPPQFGVFSDKMMKLFKKTLHPDPDERYSIKNIRKYLDMDWFKDGKVSLKYRPIRVIIPYFSLESSMS